METSIAIVGGLFTFLQAVTLYYVTRIDGRLDKHDDRLVKVEITCAGNHGGKNECN